MGNKIKYDFHTHPLVHKYYMKVAEVTLDYEDRAAIARMVRWAIDKGIQVFCPCDHNTTESSIWARAYARDNGLPIQIITGTEVSCYESSIRQEIHLGAYGIYRCPPIMKSVSDTIKAIHDQGGIAILNHPMVDDDSFVRNNIELFDGIETYNHTREIDMQYRQIKFIRKYSDLPDDEILRQALLYRGGGVWTPPEGYSKLMISGSDNHNIYEYLKGSFDYTPGEIDIDLLGKIM
jgi:predicted metal-dependent phosphoesterase TrpH